MGRFIERNGGVVMGQVDTKYTKETIEANIKQDLEDTKAFDKALGKKAPEGIKSDLELLIFIYNESLEALLRYTADVKTFIVLEEKEPWNKDWTEKKIETERILRGRRATLEALREQLLQMVKNK